MTPTPRRIFAWLSILSGLGAAFSGWTYVVLLTKGEGLLALPAFLATLFAVAAAVLTQYAHERADRDDKGLLEPSNIAKLKAGFYDLAARLKRARPYSCTACNAEFLSEGGQLVAGTCPHRRKDACPLAPVGE